MDFGRENGAKLAPKNDPKSKPPLQRKNQLNTSGLVFSWLSGSQVGSKNRSKIDLNLGRPLGIDFSWILVDFGGQVGAKLGSKIDKKSIQKGIEKQMRKRSTLGAEIRYPGPCPKLASERAPPAPVYYDFRTI